MIGGVDVRIPAPRGDVAAELAVRAILERWPDAVFENAITADRYVRYQDIPFAELEEFFIYRDPASADAWDSEGAGPSTHNSMIHVVIESDMISLVVDELDAVMNALIAAIRSAIDQERTVGTPGGAL